MNKKLIGMSKFVSLVLRHKPETIGIKLDDDGWTDVQTLIYHAEIYQKSNGWEPLTKELLDEIVTDNNKKRFEYSKDGWKIRARQGHSVKVDLKYDPVDPPEYLYHGTAEKFVASIKTSGVNKGKRHHVHLSQDYDTAVKVGKRHGKPNVLRILSKEMFEDGLKFYKTDNNVWLTDEIPVEYIEFDFNNTKKG